MLKQIEGSKAVAEAVAVVPASNPLGRVQTALNLVASSSAYQVAR